MSEEVPADISLGYAAARLSVVASKPDADARSALIDALIGGVVHAKGRPTDEFDFVAREASHEHIQPDWWRSALAEQPSWSWSGGRVFRGSGPLFGMHGPKSYADVRVLTWSFLDFLEGLGLPEAPSASPPKVEQKPPASAAGRPRNEDWDAWIAQLALAVHAGDVQAGMMASRVIDHINQRLTNLGKRELSRGTVLNAVNAVLAALLDDANG